MSIERFLLGAVCLFGLAGCGGSAQVDRQPSGAAGSAGASGASSTSGAAGASGPGGAPGTVSCEFEGKRYQVGDSFACACNTCVCLEDGTVGKPFNICFPCYDSDGVGHFAGESFPAADGCNTCQCSQDGDISCTEKACAN